MTREKLDAVLRPEPGHPPAAARLSHDAAQSSPWRNRHMNHAGPHQVERPTDHRDRDRADPRDRGRAVCNRFAADPAQAKQIASGYFTIVTDIFLRLIKMIIAPLIFATIVSGIASFGNAKAVGGIAVGARWAGSSSRRWSRSRSG